jgi:hypothetical protein
MAVTFYAIGEVIKKQGKADFVAGHPRVKLYNESEEDGMTLERFATVVEGEGEFHFLNTSNETYGTMARECKYEDGVFEVRDSQNSRIYKVRDDVAQSFAKSARISDGALKTITSRNIEAASKAPKLSSTENKKNRQVEKVSA